MDKIITTPDPRLRIKSKKVNHITDETKKIIADMIALSLDWEKSHPHELSAAMAAPQMGVNQRIIIMRDNLEDKEDQSFTALIDPKVIKTEGKIEEDYEGCLSVPNGIYGLVPRPDKARIKAKLIDGSEVRLKTTGQLTRTLLHEIDHLEGILFVDHIKDNEAAFYHLREEDGELEKLSHTDYLKNYRILFPNDTEDEEDNN
ncbi:peptide deformylase [Candidatus Saccharibacteria bacterium]|nr:peptide deformylase [Candidatus Saccharibacteria bacterium]